MVTILKYNTKTSIMNTNIFRKAIALLPILAFSALFSCTGIDIEERESIKDEIIDSLTFMVDSLINDHEEQEKLSPVMPESIVILNEDITIRNGSTAEIHFRVNPSNAEVNLDCFELDSPGAYTKAVSYITSPTYVRIKSVKAATKNHLPLRGQYVMTIEDMSVSEEYVEDITIVYASQNEGGRLFEISSDVITITSAPVSDLPRVYINTPGGSGITSKTEWVEGSTIRIIEDGTETLNMSTSIRGRGNSTWGYPKKPYALKLDSKAEVMGQPLHFQKVQLGLVGHDAELADAGALFDGHIPGGVDGHFPFVAVAAVAAVHHTHGISPCGLRLLQSRRSRRRLPVRRRDLQRLSGGRNALRQLRGAGRHNGRQSLFHDRTQRYGHPQRRPCSHPERVLPEDPPAPPSSQVQRRGHGHQRRQHELCR